MSVDVYLQNVSHLRGEERQSHRKQTVNKGNKFGRNGSVVFCENFEFESRWTEVRLCTDCAETVWLYNIFQSNGG